MIQGPQFEHRAQVAGTLGVLVALVFFGALAYWQAFRTDLATDDRNPRLLSQYENPLRGAILDRKGNLLAESLGDGTRAYYDASVAHIVGYIDARYGSQGIELELNDVLNGRARGGFEGALDAEFRHAPVEGNDVALTIDPTVQAAAVKALGSRRGAIVAIDPRNGEVLAMVSVPTYDPGALASEGDALFNDPASPLLNRATQGLYPPGSTFKAVTAASALEHGVIKADTQVTCPGEIVIDGFPVSCRNVSQGVGTYPFSDAFAFSVNAIFADVGANRLGWDRLTETAERFGFGRALDFTIETAPSQMHASGTNETKTLLAETAFGQGELLATPLQMAVVAAVVANGGVLANPHLTLGIWDENGIRSIEGRSQRRVLDAGVARTMQDLMLAVVEKGQAAGVNLPGIRVAGKTGTAETGRPGISHAWFIAYAPADRPTVALAVVVEDGGRGGEVASPIAGQVISAAVKR